MHCKRRSAAKHNGRKTTTRTKTLHEPANRMWPSYTSIWWSTMCFVPFLDSLSCFLCFAVTLHIGWRTFANWSAIWSLDINLALSNLLFALFIQLFLIFIRQVAGDPGGFEPQTPGLEGMCARLAHKPGRGACYVETLKLHFWSLKEGVFFIVCIYYVAC